MSDLPSLPCIKKLSFLNRNQIWTSALRTIIQRCTQIVELELDLEEFVRPDHLEYIQTRREGKLYPFCCELLLSLGILLMAI
jgi:hypothetical protein